MNQKLIILTCSASLAITANSAITLDKGQICSDQSEYPQIICQPENQLVQMDTSVAGFEVVAVNGPLTYQWLRNGKAIPSQTNNYLLIEKASINDVGLYSCNVAKDLEIVPTRAASLMVYSNWLDAEGIDPVVIIGTPVATSGSSGSCPGSYAGYVNYTKTVSQGWGWAPATNTSLYFATDTNRTDTKVVYVGKLGDSGCNQTSVTVPNPAISTKYRFTIYFTNNVPTNSYSIVLDGFDP